MDADELLKRLRDRLLQVQKKRDSYTANTDAWKVWVYHCQTFQAAIDYITQHEEKK